MSSAPDIRSLLSPSARAGSSSWSAAPGRTTAITFGGGLPDPDTFPIDDLARAAEIALREDQWALQYGGLYGYEGLRDLLIERIRASDGVALELEQVALTSGSAQALSLACFAFLAPRDIVIVEEPTFAGSLRAVRSYGADLAVVPIDEHGLDVDNLEELLKRLDERERRPKLLYTIPNFHNPTGVTMSLPRREKLVALAARYRFVIVEDDAYGDLRYDGAPLPSLLSLDEAGLVVKLGSFSKIAAAGLRLGWAAGDAEAIAALTSVRHDMGTSAFIARTVYHFAKDGRLAGHVKGLIGHYRRKRDAMLDALDEHCAGYASWQRPEGGFFVWLTLPRGVTTRKLGAYAADEGVGFVPGGAFYNANGGERSLRLAFSHLPLGDIERGVAGLGRALRRCVEESRSRS